jgi:hypothetical protein
VNCNRQIGAETVTMALLKYFRWVGSFLVAALFVANWCSPVPIVSSRPSDVPLNQKISIRIPSGQKWPERVVFDTSRLAPAATVDREINIGPNEAIAQAERQPFDAFAEMAPSASVFDRPAPLAKQRSEIIANVGSAAKSKISRARR